MDKVKLVQPDFADDEVAAIFDDIRKTKGANFLTPTWGFFALDIELLKRLVDADEAPADDRRVTAETVAERDLAGLCGGSRLPTLH